MPDVLNARVVTGLRVFGWLASLAGILLGGSVLAGWLCGSTGLITIRPGLAAMSPLTAFMFVLAGLSLGARKLDRTAIGHIAAMLLLGMMIAMLIGYQMYGRDVFNAFIERALLPPVTGIVGLMSRATACSFLLLGIALLALGGTEKSGRVVLGCVVLGLIISGLALLAYAYGVEGLYATAFYRTMALHTVIGLFVLFMACFVHDPERGWAALIASGLPNGTVTRVQLLLSTLLPFVIGLLALRAIRAGDIAPSLGLAAVVAGTMVPMVLRIFLDGVMLDDLDMQRRAAVEAQRQLNQELEQRVRERTESLALSEARLQTYFDHAPEGLAVFRLTGADEFVFDAVNPAFRAMYSIGDCQVAGVSPRQFDAGQFDPDAGIDELQQRLHACLRSGTPQHYTAPRVADGRQKTIDVVLAPVPAADLTNCRLVMGSMRDVTELRTREQHMRQAQKMEAIGQLTGGLAHDFNNLLTGITGSLDLLTTRLSQGRTKDLGRYVDAAQGAARRAASLTHRLLSFARRQTLDPQPTDMNRLVIGMEELVRRTVGPAIVVRVEASDGLWTTLVDPNQLENALLNLCINARDAMPDGGRLTIQTKNRHLDIREADERDLPPGEYVTLAVSDTGIGMTPEVAARAFDPFFTTKPIGVGTGLGLSMTYGFVRQSHGQARIYSEAGQGTAVFLYLPRHQGEAPEVDAPVDQCETPRAEGGETVLVVDDEPTIRMLVTEVLGDLGYTALEAADGASGLKVLQSDVGIDLLVTDVGLPGGMNGRQVADAARVLRPDLKVLFITGYAETAVLSHGHLQPGMQVLTKPFAVDVLATRIKTAIMSA